MFWLVSWQLTETGVTFFLFFVFLVAYGHFISLTNKKPTGTENKEEEDLEKQQLECVDTKRALCIYFLTLNTCTCTPAAALLFNFYHVYLEICFNLFLFWMWFVMFSIFCRCNNSKRYFLFYDLNTGVGSLFWISSGWIHT